ncbi:MAG: DUF3488 and transglutaminase-like domain-containing protein [Rhodocyclaceae bacterium]|nr:DUF3488 and transglutaminase-like domain-containing protein [Rhodocyclaceae bacterium]
MSKIGGMMPTERKAAHKENLTPAQTWWLLATGLAAYGPLVTGVPLWLSLATAAAFLWRAALAWRRRPLPRPWLLLFITLAGAAGVLLHYRTLFGQQAGTALLVLFLALKQLEARTARDGYAIVYLAYFLTLAQFFENQSIPVFLTMAGTVLVATAALASLTDPAGAPRELLRLSGGLLALALPFLLILFVLFPRVSGPLWGLPQDAYSSMTGLSDEMAPGTINNLIQSEAIAFRAQFEDAAPPKTALYWRGPVLARLEGRIWKPGKKRLGPGVPPAAPLEAPRYAYTVTLEPHNKPWLFALEFPVSLPPETIDTHDFQLHAKKPVRERIRYRVVSQPMILQRPEELDILAEALELPEGLNPRTVALGRRLAAEHRQDERIVAAALAFLRNAKLLYTLQPPLMSEHVADQFLFDYKRGFCEHFAASFAVLMRAAGIPARVVTGYQGGERNPIDGTWVIRQSDAHAWTEVWLEGEGWRRVDPTAAAAPLRIEQNLAAAVPAGDPLPLLHRLDSDFMRALRYRWWAVNNAWNQWVLGYNPERQREFLARLGMPSPDWRTMSAWLAGLSGATLLAIAGWLLSQRPRRDPLERAWGRFSRRLARRGLARHPWEGPRDYAARLSARLPEQAAEINAIAQLYSALRYGGADVKLGQELVRRIAAFKP